MAVALKFIMQVLIWFVALIIAENLLGKLVRKITSIKIWKLKKA